MATPQKRLDDSKRLRYVRVLDKFIRACIGYLVKEEDTSFEGLQLKVAKQEEFLSQVDVVPLYKEELLAKERFVQMLRSVASKPCEDFSSLKDELLHQSNQLHKDQNRRKYKKDKHTHAKFSEWE